MPKTSDSVKENKKCRDILIRKRFKAYLDDHRSVEFALSELAKQFGLAESTILKIVKEYKSTK
jgi:AraC-like DNA-binding protein